MFADEDVGLVEGVEGAGIDPEFFGFEVVHRAFFYIPVVHVGNFVFASGGRLEGFDDVEDAVVVEVKSGHGPVGGGIFWFFDNVFYAAVFAEGGHAEPFRVGNLF